MTSEEKRRTSYQNGHGKFNQYTAPIFVVLDAFFLLTGFGVVAKFCRNCRKIELWIISLHIYGNDGTGEDCSV